MRHYYMTAYCKHVPCCKIRFNIALNAKISISFIYSKPSQLRLAKLNQNQVEIEKGLSREIE